MVKSYFMQTMCFNLFCVDVRAQKTYRYYLWSVKYHIENVVLKHYPKVKLNLKMENNTDLTINW